MEVIIYGARAARHAAKGQHAVYVYRERFQWTFVFPFVCVCVRAGQGDHRNRIQTVLFPVLGKKKGNGMERKRKTLICADQEAVL